MNRTRQEKGYRKNWCGRRSKRSALAILLCAVLALGVCVPEYGMSVQAAEPAGNDGEAAYMLQEDGSSEGLSGSSKGIDLSADSASERGVDKPKGDNGADKAEKDSTSGDGAEEPGGGKNGPENSAEKPEGDGALRDDAEEPEGDNISDNGADKSEEDDASDNGADKSEEDGASDNGADKSEKDNASDNGADKSKEDNALENGADKPEGDSASDNDADKPEEDNVSDNGAEEPEDSISGNSLVLFGEAENEITSDSAAATPVGVRRCQCGYVMNIYAKGGLSADEKEVEAKHRGQHALSAELTNFSDGSYSGGSSGGGLQTVTWSIDEGGKLTVEGTGEISGVGNGGRTPWYSRRKEIQTAEVRVTGMRDASYMFDGCTNLTSVDLSGFDTSRVTSMAWMFHNCGSLKSVDLSGLDTSAMYNMNGMFYGCSALTSLNLSGVDTSRVLNMRYLFKGCSSLKSLNLSGFNTSRVTYMDAMFSVCSGLTSLDVDSFDTGRVTNMGSMFSKCSSLTSLDLSGFDTSAVNNMSSMFYDCSDLTSLDVSNFDTSGFDEQYATSSSGWRSMANMFSKCSSLTSLDLSSFDTSKVREMHDMFSKCSSLTSLDLSGFDTSSAINIYDMLSGCSSLAALYTPYHVEMSVSLPAAAGDVWYDTSGKEYTTLPTGLSYSIALARNKTPADMPGRLTVQLSKSYYALGSTVQPQDLTVTYCGPDGTKTVLPYKSGGTVSGYTMGAVDMSTSGKKTLTISYSVGENTLTKSVTFTVSTPLTDDMVTLPAGEYVYNGREQKPVPTVSADGKALTAGKDYTVSYENNIDAGTATLLVAGKDAYCGTASKTFSISRAKIENVSVTFWEPCQEAQENSTRDLSACFDETAPNNGGVANYVINTIIEYFPDTDKVLSGIPSVDEKGILTYSTNAGVDGDKVVISVVAIFTKNYENASIQVTICLKDAENVTISGIHMKNAVYSGKPVSLEGTAVVCDEDGKDITDQTTLSYRYTGTQADGTAYSSVDAPVHAGSYHLTVTVEGSDSYVGSERYPFTIGKAPLTVTARDVELEIGSFSALPDGDDLVCDITGLCGIHMAQDVLSTPPVVSYGLDGEKIDKTDIPIDKVGIYELIPSGGELNRTIGSDYEIWSYQNGTLSITDDNFRIVEVADQTYTGKAIKPAIKVYYGSHCLTEKTDYTISYKNNTKANDATVAKTAPTITVKGKGNYSGQAAITFVIKPKNIADEEVTAAELIAAQKSKVQKPVPSLVYQGRKLKNKTDFTVSYPDENLPGAYQAEGTYTVTVTGKGNYTGTRNLTYTITTKTLLTKAKISVKAKDYTGGAITLTAEDITVKVGRKTLFYGTDYTLGYRNNTEVGKATVIVTGAGDNGYAGSKEATFQIKGKSIAKAQVTGIVNPVYDGEEQAQTAAVWLGGENLRKGTDYTVSYTKALNAGTATMTITGKGRYTGSVKKKFKITAYDLQVDEAGSLEGVPEDLTVTYTKGGATPTLDLAFNDQPLTVKKDYTVSYKNNKKPASAFGEKAPAMVVKGKGNFKGTITIPFTITVSNLEVDRNVTITATDTAYVNKAGKYKVTPVLTDKNGKKLAAGTDYEKTFDYARIAPNGREIPLIASSIVSADSEVKVTVTGKGSYSGTLSAVYRITKASFSKAKVTIKSQTYTGSPISLKPEDITVKLGGKVLDYGEDYTIAPGSYQNNVKKGTATVTIKGINDYGGTKTVKFKILARPLAELLKY